MGMADLVDPKSMTIDIVELMGVNPNDILALGVVVVEVREAVADPSVVRMKGKLKTSAKSCKEVILNTCI